MFILFTHYLSDGQVPRRSIITSSISSTAYSFLYTDGFSFTGNPASLAQLNSPSIGVCEERRFFLHELSDYILALGIPSSSGNFGLEALYCGFSDFNESQLGLVYGRKLGNKVDIGAQFNYNSFGAAGYEQASTISIEAGTVLHVTDRFHTGLHISNPIGGKFGNSKDERLPVIYTGGFGYDVSDKFFFGITIEKEEDQPVNVIPGLQYRFHRLLLARAGISSATSSVWLGVGMLYKSLRIDILTGYHPQLGISPGLGLLYNFNSKKG